MVIAGCSRRKARTAVPVPALSLYQGGCIPALRSRIEAWPQLRARTWIISAGHGLVHADMPLLPYDRRMDPGRAADLRGGVSRTLDEEFRLHGAPPGVLVIAEPAYQLALASLPGLVSGLPACWVSDPAGGWPDAEAFLDRWSPSCP